MKTIFESAIALCLAVVALTPGAHAQTVQDEWWTPAFSARVKLSPCDDKLCGSIVWAWDDTPGGASDKRPLAGQRIISGMKLEQGDKAHQGDKAGQGASPVYRGNIYNPEDGQTYKATMRLKSANTLLVEGCVLFICREQVWRRHDSLKSPPVALGP